MEIFEKRLAKRQSNESMKGVGRGRSHVVWSEGGQGCRRRVIVELLLQSAPQPQSASIEPDPTSIVDSAFSFS